MSRANVEAIGAVYERWAAGDFAASVELFDPEVSFVLGPGFPDAGVHRRPAGIAKYMHGFLEPWERITIQAEELIDAGDGVLASVRQRGVGSGSGAATELRYFQLWSFRGDRVIRLENFRERGEAFAAAGLPEQRAG